MNSINIYILLFLSQGVFSVDPSSLRLISVVFRHGDRSPVDTYKTDPNQESSWPQGFGQLTNQGVNRSYNLGAFLRERYDGFLNRTYKREEIYMRSTDKDRTLMTAQAVLNGLYPPTPEQTWKDGLNWQPIPVHTVDLTGDVLYGNKRCTTARQRFQEIITDPNLVHYVNEKYAAVFDVLDKNSGNSSFSNATGKLTLEHLLTSINHVTDATFCEKHSDRDVPLWIDGIWEQLLELQRLWHYLEFADPKLARLHGGVMLGQFVWDMQLRVSNLLPPHMKAFIYSGHDTTLWNLASALGLFKNQSMFYSTCMMIELHQDTQQQYHVKMFRRDGETEKVEPMIIDKCEEACPLERFINLTHDAIPEDRERECAAYGSLLDLDFSNPSTIVFTSIVGGVIVLLLLTVVLAVCCGRGRRSARGLSSSRLAASVNARRHGGYGKLRAAMEAGGSGGGGVSAEEMPMIVQHGSDDE